jgi:hypothetical protein
MNLTKKENKRLEKRLKRSYKKIAKKYKKDFEEYYIYGSTHIDVNLSDRYIDKFVKDLKKSYPEIMKDIGKLIVNRWSTGDYSIVFDKIVGENK